MHAKGAGVFRAVEPHLRSRPPAGDVAFSRRAPSIRPERIRRPERERGPSGSRLVVQLLGSLSERSVQRADRDPRDAGKLPASARVRAAGTVQMLRGASSFHGAHHHVEHELLPRPSLSVSNVPYLNCTSNVARNRLTTPVSDARSSRTFGRYASGAGLAGRGYRGRSHRNPSIANVWRRCFRCARLQRGSPADQSHWPSRSPRRSTIP
jgi:hypothetical protein